MLKVSGLCDVEILLGTLGTLVGDKVVQDPVGVEEEEGGR